MAVRTADPPAHAQTVQRMYQHQRQKARKEALLNPTLQGTCTFTFKGGKQQSVSATLSDPGGNTYIDVTGKPFPSKIDMGEVTSITFKPHTGRQRAYSSWNYLYNAGWRGLRLTNLA